MDWTRYPQIWWKNPILFGHWANARNRKYDCLVINFWNTSYNCQYLELCCLVILYMLYHQWIKPWQLKKIWSLPIIKSKFYRNPQWILSIIKSTIDKQTCLLQIQFIKDLITMTLILTKLWNRLGRVIRWKFFFLFKYWNKVHAHY